MKNRIKKSCLVLGLFVFITTTGLAQNAYDALRYSTSFPGNDAINLAQPGAGVSQMAGLGAVLENPATMGLFNSSQLSLGMGLRSVTEESQYLNTGTSFDDSQAGISEFNGLYKIPTKRGNFVIGAGYNQTQDFNRAYSVDVFNSQHSITDMFNQSGFYGDAAYNAFAIDSAGSVTQSVLRMGQFQGVDQYVETIETGKMGEYNFYFATEFQQDLYVGASLGIISGTYNYKRTFIEEDPSNLYDGYDGTYDFMEMYNEDTINADLSGATFRAGIVYRIQKWLNLGLSYQSGATIKVHESYKTKIITRFDNYDRFEDSFSGSPEYKIERPQRLKAGLSANNIDGLSLHAAVERVDYGNMALKNLGDIIYQNDENRYISNRFSAVYNVSGGVSYLFENGLTARGGVAYHPDPQTNMNRDRWFVSGGVTVPLSEHMKFNLGAQYATWNDQTVMYQYYNTSNQSKAAVVDGTVHHIQMMGGLQIAF